MKNIILYISAVYMFFLSCSGGYAPPILNPKTFVYEIAGSKEQLFNKAILVLDNLGYSLKTKNVSSGIIQTKEKAVKFTSSECDCGSYYNKKYTGDPQTKIKPVFFFNISDGVVKISSKIIADYYNQSGRIVKNDLECISSGQYEKHLAELIAGQKIPD